MREFFSQFGKVVDATVMLDRETGRSKGFGFVSFENVNVEPLLGFGNLEIDGKMVCVLNAMVFLPVLTIPFRQIDVKLAQPRSQREGGGFQDGAAPNTGGGGGGARGNFNNGGFQNSGGAYGTGATGAATSGTPAAGGASSSFDPQALASLYTRMITMGSMNPMMGGGMNPMMGGMAAGGPGYGGPMGGMRMPMAGPMGGPGMMGGMGMGGMGMGMGRGGPGMAGPGMMAGGPMNVNVPRGPRGTPTGPNAGVGPQRAGQRGAHNYHPYAR